MYCKFCGENIEDNAVFCSKCGAKMHDIEEAMASTTAPSKTRMKRNSSGVDKCCFAGMILGAFGAAIFLAIVLVGLFVYDKVYLFNGYNYTKVLLIISLVFMLVGLCSIIAKCVSIFVFKKSNLPVSTVKRICAVCLAVICLSFSTWGVIDAIANTGAKNNSVGSSNSSGSTNSSVGNYEQYGLTKSQAISYAKNSSVVQNKIAEMYNLKFFYTPDWGTVEADENEDGSWWIVLYGNVSGYTDNYKKDFVYDKSFKVTVEVSRYGFVTYKWGSKY